METDKNGEHNTVGGGENNAVEEGNTETHGNKVTEEGAEELKEDIEDGSEGSKEEHTGETHGQEGGKVAGSGNTYAEK